MSTRPLAVASLYNRYLTRGGEDEAFEAEIGLLERNGVRVVPVEAQTQEPRGRADTVRLGLETVWSTKWYRTIQRLIEDAEIDLIHVHNAFPVMSPSIFHASRRAGVPVVHTLHNYRLVCPSAVLFRDGHPCEDCIGRLPHPGIRHRCYHGSLTKTSTIAAMLSVHRLLRTWSTAVDVYITLSEFSRARFMRGGLPPEKLTVKPNFVDPDPGVGAESRESALYVGRLSQEKGVRTMLEAWKGLDAPLRVIGDGPLAGEVDAVALANPRVTYLGRQPRRNVLDEMRHARVLIFPSEWFESCPITLIEAFACGLPVIATSHGATGEIVENGRTGIHFEAGNPQDLRAKVSDTWTDLAKLARIGHNARAEYESKYTAEQNFRQLMTIYSTVLPDPPGARHAS